MYKPPIAYSPKCITCNHSKVKDINRLIFEGKPLSELSEIYGISPSTLANHKKNHLKRNIKKDAESQGDVLSSLEEIRTSVALDPVEKVVTQGYFENYKFANMCFQEAFEKDKLNYAIQSLGEARRTLDSINKNLSLYETKARKTDWNKVMNRILNALDEYPQAKLKVSSCLEKGFENET